MDSAWELSQSPLAQYRDLQALGQRRFARRAFLEGWTLQAVLRLAWARVAGALEPRKGGFLRRCVAGKSIAGIAASAGMSRSHLSRRWRPQVLEAVDAAISNLRRDLRGAGAEMPRAPDDAEPAGGLSHASVASTAARHGRGSGSL